MSFNIGPTISVAGEREFASAMSRVRESMKYVNSEAALAASAFDKNEKSVASLTAKNDVLRKALGLQRTAVQEAENALARMREKGVDPASTAYQSMTANLNNAKAALNNTSREIKENEKAMSGLQKQGMGLGDALDKVTGKLGFAIPQGAKDSMNALLQFDAKMVATAGVIAAASAAVYKLEEAFFKMTLAQAAAADKIGTQSMITGISEDQLEKFAYAAELIDVPVETIVSSMSKMIRSMSDAKKGTGDAAEGFKTLGIRVTDSHGQLRDSQVVFDELIDRLGRMQNATERDALSMKLFGRSAQDLNPLIIAGSARLRELGEEAEKMGFTLDDVQRNKLKAVDDAFWNLNNQMTASKNLMAVELSPALAKFLEAGQNALAGLGKLAVESGFVDVLASTLELVTALGPAFQTTGSIIGPMIGNVLKPLAMALAVVADALTVAISFIAGFIESVKTLLGSGSIDKVNQYTANIERVFSNQGAIATTFNNLYGGNVKKYATGTQYHPGGLAIVHKDELIDMPVGSRVYTAQQTRQMLGGNVQQEIKVYVQASGLRQIADVVELFDGFARNRNAGLVRE